MQKLLVFEFITGGGFSQQALPESLAEEGLLMLKALVSELTQLSGYKITLMLDWRMDHFTVPDTWKVVRVSNQQCIYDLLPSLIEGVDRVWPIAPEMDSILFKISQIVESKSRTLLNSSTAAVALCGDKFLTYQFLKQHKITSIETHQLDLFTQDIIGEWVIKPKDGVGCINSYLVSSNKEMSNLKNKIENQSDFIIQPYINGMALSLSCLFKNGKAWLLCCNQQYLSHKNRQFELEACVVNVFTKNRNIYEQLIGDLARVMPGLSAYVGIDIIQPAQKPPYIVEINPRLTSSYAGIQQATGLNVAKLVIEIAEIDPIIHITRQNQIRILGRGAE